MAEVIRIQEIAQHVEQEVTIRGWLYYRTDKGRLQFLQVRDGTGIVQAVAFKKELAPEVFEQAQTVTQESSIVVTGTVHWPRHQYMLTVSHMRNPCGLCHNDRPRVFRIKQT